MSKPSPKTRSRICHELAERMGYFEWKGAIYKASAEGNERVQSWPDFFTDHADNAELMQWLAADDHRWMDFLDAYQITAGWKYDLWKPTLIKVVMTSPLAVRVMAACKALGIDTES